MDVWGQVVVDMRHRVGSKVALVFVEALMAAAAKRNSPLFCVLGDISQYSRQVQLNLLSLASISCKGRLENVQKQQQQQDLRSKESNMLEVSSSTVPACQIVGADWVHPARLLDFTGGWIWKRQTLQQHLREISCLLLPSSKTNCSLSQSKTATNLPAAPEL